MTACIPCGEYLHNQKNPSGSSSSSAVTRTGSPAPFYGASSLGGGILLPDTLASSAYLLRCADLFWTAYLPNSQAIPTDVHRHLADGLSGAVRHFGTDGVVRKAVFAIALTSFGRRPDGTSMKEDGKKIYRSALGDLAVAIKKSNGQENTELLATLRLFSLYEVGARFCLDYRLVT